MMALTDRTGKTQLRCVKCDKVDPMKTDAVKWANSGLSGPTNAALNRDLFLKNEQSSDFPTQPK
jgi:hypothetical protein